MGPLSPYDEGTRYMFCDQTIHYIVILQASVNFLLKLRSSHFYIGLNRKLKQESLLVMEYNL